jgi:hypothetical protein
VEAATAAVFQCSAKQQSWAFLLAKRSTKTHSGVVLPTTRDIGLSFCDWCFGRANRPRNSHTEYTATNQVLLIQSNWQDPNSQGVFPQLLQ